MITKTEKTNGADIQGQCSGQRRGAGIIPAILSVLFLLGTAAARHAQAQTFIVLHNFAGSPNDGAGPDSRLVMDSSGNLYGTTNYGGTSNNCPVSVPGLPDSCGTVFKLDTSGTLTVLHNFAGSPSDGSNPVAGLVRDASGNLYGTTLKGGASASCSSGCGTVFKLDTSNTLTVLHNFSYSDGANPFAGLATDSSGNLYGTTSSGGPSHDGTVFKLDTSNTLIPLHDFAGSPSDGSNPESILVRDSAGNLYGTTSNGGTSTNCSSGCGTVFKLDTSGTLTVLHNFSGSDGANPTASLVGDSAGNLYGTTLNGGTSTNCSSGCGTVFKLETSGGGLTVLHNFSGSDGANPFAGLVSDSNGNLYGTTGNGGNSSECNLNDGCGTVFKLDTSGALTVLHSFSGSDGVYPFRRLVMDSAGNLYGTTFNGGTSNNCPGSPIFGPAGCGTVFVVSTTAQGGAQAIANQVNGLMAQGVINSGQNNSLVTKLQNAIAMTNAGKINGAIGKLEGFIHEVNALENSRRLTGAQGSALTSAATSVVQQLQAM